jgi:hypothetical protein
LTIIINKHTYRSNDSFISADRGTFVVQWWHIYKEIGFDEALIYDSKVSSVEPRSIRSTKHVSDQ